jgi:hypothetical protein
MKETRSAPEIAAEKVLHLLTSVSDIGKKWFNVITKVVTLLG